MNSFQKISKNEYNIFFDKAPFSTFFHNPEWHDFLENEFKWLKFKYFLYKNEAVLPFAGLMVFGKEKLISLPFCEYGGPLLIGDNLDFEEFRACAISDFGEDIKIKFHPEILKNFNVLSPKPQNSNIYTSWIEILKTVSEQELLSSFRKTLRHEIRNAQNKNLEIRKCRNLRELKNFYGLYAANLKRKKTVPYPYVIFEFLFSRPEAEIMLAFLKGKIVGGNLFLDYDKFKHYFFSAIDYKYRDYGSAHLLLWEKIRSLIGKDKIFDLGATSKDSSLDIFKRGWGGKEYPIVQIGTNKSLDGLRASRLRNVWELLPDFIIKKLSYRLIKYRI